VESRAKVLGCLVCSAVRNEGSEGEVYIACMSRMRWRGDERRKGEERREVVRKGEETD
jgi:hypothetical protein